MRVIHLSCVAPPETGGIGVVAFEEVQHLNERGIEARLVAPSGMRVGNSARMSLRPLMSDLHASDIVHLHYPFYGTAGRIAKLRKRGIIRRLVITLHMDATATGFKGFVFDVHRRLFQSGILNAADVLLASSLDYVRHSSLAPFAGRVRELPFGVDAERFSPISGLRTQDSGLRTILHVGGMDRAHAFKGVPVLLAAMAKLPSAILELVGDGDLRLRYEEIAREFGVADRVRFLGRIGSNELAVAYRRADVFAFPSTSGAEAFGLAALEAEACGLPVVASDLPGVRTVVVNGETGFLVPPNDADALAKRLGFLFEHPEVRQAMGRRARERVLETFTWNKHVDGLVQIYQDVCASPS